MNTNHNQSQTRQEQAARHRFGIALVALITAHALAALPAQAAQVHQGPPIVIEEPVVTAINQLYLNRSTTYQAQWTQLIQDVAPDFRFARAVKHTTCLPALAYDASFAPNPGASLKSWPVPGQSGCTQTERLDEMVTYVDPRLCDPNTLRFGYWLYFKKDGFSALGPAKGHRHDWEGVIVELKRATAGGPVWARSQVIGSYHREYKRMNWTDSSLQKTEDGKHPIMFVGWAHHAMHWDKGGSADWVSTFYNDVRNSYLKLDAWNNLVIIPMQPDAALRVLADNTYFGKANPPLTKDICAI